MLDESKLVINGRQYLIEQKLGEGSGGVVYKATAVQNGAECAIKRLRYSKNRDILRYIESEIDLLKQFNHRNIIRYYDDQWVPNRYIYIVMEVGEMNLKQHIEVYGEDGSLSEKESIGIGLEILRGLAQLHSKRIIHRDLKTENILYRQGVWKLSDFGIAVKLDETEQAGTLLGTPYYLAPEILRNESYSYGVDIWCFGIILFEIYFGFVPFYKEEMASPMELLSIIEKVCLPRFDLGKLMKNYIEQHVPADRLEHIRLKLSIASAELLDLFGKIFVVEQQERLTFYGLWKHAIIKAHCPNTYKESMKDTVFYSFLEGVKRRQFYMHEHLEFLLKTIESIRESSEPVVGPHKVAAIGALELAVTFFNRVKYRNKGIESRKELEELCSRPWEQVKNLIKQPLVALYQVLRGCNKLHEKKMQLQVLISIKSHTIFESPDSFGKFFQQFFASDCSLIQFDHFLSNLKTKAEFDKLAAIINHLLVLFHGS